MAESDDGQEKTEEPTPRKLEKAREEGQVPRSKELNTALVLIAGLLGLIVWGQQITSAMIGVMQFCFSFDRALILTPSLMLLHLNAAASSAFWSILPLMVLVTVATFAAPSLMGGWLLSAKALTPKFSRMNPIKGIGRMFSMNSLVELGKSLAKFMVVATIAINVLIHYQPQLMSLGHGDVDASMGQALEIFLWSVLLIACAMILIVIVDVPYQLYDSRKKLKMTMQEVKDEMKDSEGKPEVKGRIRQLQMEMAQRRMMEAVPEADVVITNPEHFAVALKYDPERGDAPILVAKGSDHLAFKIREIAEAHEVNIMASPALARAVYYSTELEQSIPEGLYMAVAQVLAYVFQLKAFKNGKGERPREPGSVFIPENLQFGADGRVMGSNARS